MATATKKSLVSRAGAAARKVVSRSSATTKKAAPKKSAPAKKTTRQEGAREEGGGSEEGGPRQDRREEGPRRQEGPRQEGGAGEEGGCEEGSRQEGPRHEDGREEGSCQEGGSGEEGGARRRPPAKKAAPATKAAATKTAPAKKAAPATKAAAKKAPAKRAASASKLVVLEQEDPWTKAELNEVRATLKADVARLTGELVEVEEDLAGMIENSGEGAGNDQADVGSASFERDQEMVIVNNARDMLEQSQHALERIANGTYGQCEICGNPIGKNRLMAFPRATLCLSCKQREERR